MTIAKKKAATAELRALQRENLHLAGRVKDLHMRLKNRLKFVFGMSADALEAMDVTYDQGCWHEAIRRAQEILECLGPQMDLGPTREGLITFDLVNLYKNILVECRDNEDAYLASTERE